MSGRNVKGSSAPSRLAGPTPPAVAKNVEYRHLERVDERLGATITRLEMLNSRVTDLVSYMVGQSTPPSAFSEGTDTEGAIGSIDAKISRIEAIIGDIGDGLGMLERV